VLAGVAFAVACCVICCGPRDAAAFVTQEPETTDIESAPRWVAAPDPAVGEAGLFDGITVAIEPGLAEKLALAVTGEMRPEDVAAVEMAVRAAFASWESTVLRFNVTFDGPVQRGPTVGAEIDVFVVPDSDPVFQGNAFFGVTDTVFEMVEGRVLTNGDVLPGLAIVGADIFLDQDTIAGVSSIFTRAQQPAALQRLVTHETGHALGFGHPVDFAEFNYDTDDNPLNVMVIDFRDPLVDLRRSPTVDPNAVMSNSPTVIDALLLTALSNDERGGRDALYPGPPETDCAADCDANGAVAIDELVRAVRIALGEAFFVACPAADPNHDLEVAIDELVSGVRGALDGCAAEQQSRR